jgi:hypothetical protein
VIEDFARDSLLLVLSEGTARAPEGSKALAQAEH